MLLVTNQALGKIQIQKRRVLIQKLKSPNKKGILKLQHRSVALTYVPSQTRRDV
ncbi:unnamed protein product [Brassica oleracea var. botrytis]|uniref:(rape) hypothetical protein n=1 Tax=Brassica napus TaxID=3708 RepID=A0A816IU38_BRANA|nr:unnamed protein product [Brassica napus]